MTIAGLHLKVFLVVWQLYLAYCSLQMLTFPYCADSEKSLTFHSAVLSPKSLRHNLNNESSTFCFSCDSHKPYAIRALQVWRVKKIYSAATLQMVYRGDMMFISSKGIRNLLPKKISITKLFLLTLLTGHDFLLICIINK